MKRISAVVLVCVLALFVTFSAFADTFIPALKFYDREIAVDFEVYTAPAKTEYIVGETVDLTGFSARIYTDYGFVTQNLVGKANASFEKNTFLSQSDVEITVTPKVFTEEGSVDVIIAVDDAKYVFTVNVISDPDMVCGIDIGSLPKKLEYNVGDTIDLTGFSATLFTGNGYVTEKLRGSGSSFAKNSYLTGYGITPKVSPSKFDKAGSIKVVVSAGDAQASFTVTVKGNDSGSEDSDDIVSMMMNSKPDKLEYNVGDTIDLKGFSAILVTGNGYVTERLKGTGSSFAENSYLKGKNITPTVTPVVFDKAGVVKVKVVVGDAACSFDVTVNGGDSGNEDGDDIVSLEILKDPDKLSYNVGEKVDMTGLEIRMYTENGFITENLVGEGEYFKRNLILEKEGIVPVVEYDFSAAGNILVYIRVGEASCSYGVSVLKPDEEPSDEPIEASDEESEDASEEDTSEEDESDEEPSDTDEETDKNVSNETSEGSASEPSENSKSDTSGAEKDDEDIKRDTNKREIAKYVIYGGIFVTVAALTSFITYLILKRKKK